jgi:thiol:disulfide interchange protein DsbD
MTRPRPESLPARTHGRRASVVRTFAFVGAASLAASLHVGPVCAEIKLLPGDQAFRYAVRALDATALEAQFTIADGYYLYRDKLRFAVEPADHAGAAPALPPGKVKDDEFFGRVETYRDRVVVRVPLQRAAAGQTVTLRAESQGCADVGVCYPPAAQQLTVVIPGPGQPAGPLVEATPAKKGWFK